jgi:aminoglycoside 3-N-acetyltransferase
MPAGVLKAAKAAVRKRLKTWRHRYAATFRAFTPDDLLRHLRQLGVQRGDTLLVHSSFDAFEGFTGKPTDIIAALQEAVGPDGALLMPTMPFSGTAVDYVTGAPVFDVARTPSRMGLVTELFRRSPGVVRSVHPTHSVAVWGTDAESVAAGHHEAKTPCGAGTPFARMLERRGRILMLGADIDSLTFYHMVEEAIEARLPASPFTEQVYHLASKRKDGTVVNTDTRLFEPAVSRRRNLHKLVPELKRRGAWREGRIGLVATILLDATEVYATVIDMADRGIYCYD